MADPISLETALTRAECNDRLQGRIERRTVSFRIDATRPVRGRSSLDGFVLRRSRDPIVEALGTYLLGASGGTRIDLRLRLAWARQLPWMAVNVIVLGPAGGIVLAASGRIPGDTVTVLVAAALMGAFVLVLQLLVIALAFVVYGPRQRTFLRTFVEGTLLAQ